MNDFRIYPNPNSDGKLYIASLNDAVISVNVYDVLGKRVMQANVEDSILDVGDLQSGLYMIQLTQGNSSVTKRLVID